MVLISEVTRLASNWADTPDATLDLNLQTPETTKPRLTSRLCLGIWYRWADLNRHARRQRILNPPKTLIPMAIYLDFAVSQWCFKCIQLELVDILKAHKAHTSVYQAVFSNPLSKIAFIL
ncbi:hypothetical protein BBM50_03720 [Vibrio parahaemolyticus]|nr:hypothetical protein BBM50_03720 [Vibrio parahaemolyticus]OEA03354.1 hypothetical protein BBM51_10300 [Vibrio parahaemolyticus]